MKRNRIIFGIILSIFLLVFSVPGFTAYYKYTQESGANFYVGTGDKADALEDTNEMRQILDDFGALLVHSKRNDLYPKDGTTGGTIQIPEAGLKFSNAPVNDDIAAYIAGEMMWQTKAELSLLTDTANVIDSLHYTDVSIDHEHLSPDIISGLPDVTSEDTDYILVWDNTDSLLKKVDMGEVRGTGGYTNLTQFVDQTAWRLFYSNNLGDVIELAFGTDGQYLKSTGAASAPIFDDPAGAGDMLKATYDTDEDGDIDVAAGGTEKSSWTLYAIPYLSGTTAFGEIFIGTAGQVLKVSAGATGYEFANESDPTVDSDAKIKAILVDEVTKTGDFTAGRIAKINNATGIIEQGTNTDTDVADAVTKKHSQNTDTQFDFYNALASDHTWSGDKDTQPVGESVVFGEILYFNWTDKEWKKAKADAFATAKGTRIALESKADGETCLMLVKGYIRDDSAFDFGAARVFLNDDTGGACDDTAPAESGDQIFVVGEAKSADVLFFDPGKDVGEI